MSLPVRGAWIEICHKYKCSHTDASLPVRGAWIEIVRMAPNLGSHHRRSPCGERGLKYNVHGKRFARGWSLPVRGAWIEIAANYARVTSCTLSLPVRGAWIEMGKCNINNDKSLSLPVRGAWIEIRSWRTRIWDKTVAPRAGSVD